jgi:hypothetical protein
MAPCPTCGRELNYVEQYGQYYCYTCQQYQQPSARAAPPPPPPPPPPGYVPPPPYQTSRPPTSKSKFIFGGVIVIIIIIILASYFLLVIPKEDEGNKYTMSFQELIDDMEDPNDFSDFKTLEPGDTVIVEDTISDIDYDGAKTQITFESYDAGEFVFLGDLTDEYDYGDKIRITLHIIVIEYDGKEFEFFKEMWDGESIVFLPDNVIRIVKDEVVYEEARRFPTIEVSIMDRQGGDRISIKHVQGDPLDWSNHKIIMANTSDEMQYMTILNLTEEITAGEITVIEISEYKESRYGYINFQKTLSYDMEIYNKKENKRTYARDNIICE